MNDPTTVPFDNRPLTIVLSCADVDLETRLTKELTGKGCVVILAKRNLWPMLYQIYQSHASLLILQTNTLLRYEKEVEYCHLLDCKVLRIETHITDGIRSRTGQVSDAQLQLPLDMDCLLGLVRCLPHKSSLENPPRLTLHELLEHWQVTCRQPNREMIESAVLLIVEHPDWAEHITKNIYPHLAQRYRLSVTAVEQRLRRAITNIYLYHQDERFRALFQEQRPSNTQFCVAVARYLMGYDEDDPEQGNP